MTTLEEVFLHLGEEEEADDNDTANADTSIRDKAMTRQLSVGSENTLKVPENHSKDKNASGYSFEAVETHKSSWQMFKALVYLRTLMRFREPAMFFVQIVMPVIYICLGVFLSDLSEPNVNQDNEAILTPHMYEDDFYPYLY